MSFVPVTGTATFRAAEPPRESVVEFVDERRTVALPIRAALPVLTKAHGRDDLHPSLRLLSGAALLGLRLVAAGKLEPATGPVPSWRISPLDAADTERVLGLARVRAGGTPDGADGDGNPDGLDELGAVGVVREVLDAIADAMPRSAPTAPAPATAGSRPDFATRLQRRIDRHGPGSAPAAEAGRGDLPQLVRLSLRLEADEEELVAGAVRLVLQVHDERDALHVADASSLWLDGPERHGFGERARTHATIALRAAAQAWAPLDRLLELRVPDQISLDTDEILSLLDRGVADLDEAGVEVMWPKSLGRDLLSARTVLDRQPRRGAPGAAGHREEPLQSSILGTEQLFAFRWQLAIGGDPLTEDEMDVLAASASPVVKLRGSWTVIDAATVRKARKRLVRVATPVQAVAAALTGVVDVDDTDEEVVVGATLLPVRERLLGAARREPVDVPPALRATLRDYQREGLTWLAELTDLGLGACLADDMGLGKTVTVIALHLHRVAAGHGGPMLVVCPASLLGNWEAEIRRFAPSVACRRLHGGQRSLDGLDGAEGALVGGSAGVVLTTYGTMRANAQALAAVGWDLVVADEAQHVKNPRTATARALRTIGSGRRIALTGTPVENDLTELWAILDWTNPGLLGSRNAFRKVWAAPIEAGVDPAVTRRFADLIGPFLLRRTKADPGVAPELPAKTETDHPLRLTREQTVLYEAFVRDTMERIERSDPEHRRGLVLALLTGLKQICNHPAHFLKQSGLGGRGLAGRSEKLDLVDELLGTVLAEGGAALVFTQYVAMGRLLSAHLERAGVTHQFLHGGTPVREREAMVARFQAGAGADAGDVPVFLLSLKAGGTGLNLTRADHVIHLDRWWNPAVEEQATDRAYRIGQTRPVQVHRLITRGTVEERIAELLTRKRALADAVLARGEAALTELSDADLRDLVTLRQV